jgi:heptosyltransferase II
MKILFVKTHALGDVLMTTPAIRHAAQVCPDAQYDFLSGKAASLLLLGNPHLHDQIYIDEQALFGWKKHLLLPLIARLRQNAYDRACVFAPGKAMIGLLRRAGIRDIYAPSIGSSHSHLAGSLPWEPQAPRYIGEFYLQLARLALGLDSEVKSVAEDLVPELCVLGEGQEIIDRLLEKLSLTGIPLLLVAPGGGRNVRQTMAVKRWAPERFAEVAAYLCRDYGFLPVLVGDRYDGPCAEVVWQMWGEQGLNLLGGTTLLTLPALVNRSSFILCNDSLLMHLAVALGKPFVSIFGPTYPRALLPPSFLLNAVTPTDAECAPCTANEVFPGCEASPLNRCIDSITVEMVWERARRILGDHS